MELQTIFIVFVSIFLLFQQGASDSSSTSVVSPPCLLNLVLSDSQADGWENNKIQLFAGSTPIPLNASDAYGAVDAQGCATILVGATASFVFSVPMGTAISAKFVYNKTAFPQENSWIIQLAMVVPAFGPVVLGKSSFVNTTNGGSIVRIPQMANITNVICGPLPPTVSNVNVSIGSISASILISWSPIVSSTAPNSSATVITFLYFVQYRDASIANAPWNSLGTSTNNNRETILASQKNYQFAVTALNQYGPSSPAYVTYTTPVFSSCTVNLTLFDAGQDGWDPTGVVQISLDDVLLAVAGFPCATPGIQCAAISYPVTIPIFPGVQSPLTLSTHFVAPTIGVKDCSYGVYLNSTVLITSGTSSSGPLHGDNSIPFQCPVTKPTCPYCCAGTGQCDNIETADGFCCASASQCCVKSCGQQYTCCQNSDRCLLGYNGTAGSTCVTPPTPTCPVAQPLANSTCPGKITCTFGQSCCCPNETNVNNRACGPSVQYQCSGDPNAVWSVTPLPLPCASDPAYTCPSQCPAKEPSQNTSLGACGTSKSCYYSQSCCCPAEPNPVNQICTNLHQWACGGQNGSTWSEILITPAPCPALCYSSAKSGTCPASTGTGVCSSRYNQCSVDGDCTGTEKCCPGNCGNACVSPCDCSVVPQCQPWQTIYVNASASSCCGGLKVCVDNANSTACPTAVPSWGTCQFLTNTTTCGAGIQYRSRNTRDPVFGCLVTLENQTCTVPCPVNCQGSYGPPSACSISCGTGGSATAVYTVTQQAAYGGLPCPHANNETSVPFPCNATVPCPSPVQAMCTFALQTFCSYGSGWWGAHLDVYVNNNYTLTTSVPGSNIGPVVYITVPYGGNITLSYTGDGIASFESYTLSHSVANAILTPEIIANPSCEGQDNCQGPTPDVTVIALCADCSKVDPTVCQNTQHRGPCQPLFSQSSCGDCLSGWTAPSTNPFSACVDIDECANNFTNPCVARNAECVNSAGSFTCTCPSGTVLTAGFCETPGVCPPIRLRQEWFTLSAQEKHAFYKAIKYLHDIGQFSYLWNKHGMNSNWFTYAHNTPGFPYFHRAYLLEVENLIRTSSDPDLQCYAIPYFDWTAIALLQDPNTFLQENFFTDQTVDGYHIGIGSLIDMYHCSYPNHTFGFINDGASGCLWRVQMTPVDWQTPQAVWQQLLVSDFPSMWSNLLGLHFHLHDWMGGDFNMMTSPSDPYFLLHHSFTEYLFLLWQTCHNYLNESQSTDSTRWDVSYNAQYQYSSPIPGFPSATPQTMYNLAQYHVQYSGNWLNQLSDGNLANDCPAVFQNGTLLPSAPFTATSSFLEMETSKTSMETSVETSMLSKENARFTEGLRLAGSPFTGSPSSQSRGSSVAQGSVSSNNAINQAFKNSLEGGGNRSAAALAAFATACGISQPTSCTYLSPGFIQDWGIEFLSRRGSIDSACCLWNRAKNHTLTPRSHSRAHRNHTHRGNHTRHKNSTSQAYVVSTKTTGTHGTTGTTGTTGTSTTPHFISTNPTLRLRQRISEQSTKVGTQRDDPASSAVAEPLFGGGKGAELLEKNQYLVPM